MRPGLALDPLQVDPFAAASALRTPNVSLTIGATYEPNPPGEEPMWLYRIGPLNLFYWQWLALGAALVLTLAMTGPRRR